jgi:hypothetical protein
MKTNKVSSISTLAIVITIAAVSAFVLACGSSYPSESAGRRYCEQHGTIDGYTKLKSFTKTNGSGDDRSYEMEYEAEYECQKVNTLLGTTEIVGVCKKVGQIFKTSDRIQFTKTENGWRAPDGKIY